MFGNFIIAPFFAFVNTFAHFYKKEKRPNLIRSLFCRLRNRARIQNRAQTYIFIKISRFFIKCAALLEESLEHAFFAGGILLAEGVGELTEQFFLLGVQVFRSFNKHGDDKIATALGVDVGNSLTLEGE